MEIDQNPGSTLGSCWCTTNDDGRINKPATGKYFITVYRTVPLRQRRRQVDSIVRLYTEIGSRYSVWQYCKKQ